MYKELLPIISASLINSSHQSEEMKAASALADFFFGWKQNQCSTGHEDELLEFPTNAGIAISTKEAANCTTDYLRTTRFIKGVYAAINELINRFPDQRIRVLYAGCGPYATLIVPLLPFFSVEQLDLVLLDINARSLESAQCLINDLGFEQYDIRFVEMDATAYKGDNGFHMILTETMFQGLIREPQVAITENLCSQLIPNGIFIPDEIMLDAVCTSFGKEPHVKGNEDDLTWGEDQSSPVPKRLQLGHVFSICAETNFYVLTNGTFRQIQSHYYRIPDEVNNHPDVCIFTRIRIFGTVYLHPSESLITNPHCVASLANMTGHSHFKLVYNYRPVPGWRYEFKK